MRKYIFPLIIGITSLSAITSYGILKSRKEEQIQSNISNFEINDENYKSLVEKSQSINAEYIFKVGENEAKDKSCMSWKEGKISYMSEEDCKKLISEIWKDKLEKQPDIWFRAGKENIEEVLKMYFPNSESWKGVPLNYSWFEEPFECFKESPVENEKIEVSCSYTNESIQRIRE